MTRLVLCLITLSLTLCEAAMDAQVKAQRHHNIEINGVKLHYVVSGSGKTILFLHGFPEFWYAWNKQLELFGHTYQAVAVDMRGYNLSEKPKKLEDYAISKLVADIKGVLEKVSPGKPAILVAHDWGGALAWVFATQHPEMLEKLVIINAPHPAVFARELAFNADQQKASGYMNLFKSAQAETVLSADNYAALVTGIFGSAARPGSFSEEDRKAYLEAWAQPGALTGGLNYYRASGIGPPTSGNPAGQKPSVLSQLPSGKIKVPTLVIWGEKDTALLTGNLNGLDKYVEKLIVKRIPNGTHWVVHDEPELVNQLIADFIQEPEKK